MPSVIPKQVRHSKKILIFDYVSDVICSEEGTMSNPRQEGPSTGLVAAAVLFLAFAAKDLFSEDTPGARGDHDDDDAHGSSLDL